MMSCSWAKPAALEGARDEREAVGRQVADGLLLRWAELLEKTVKGGGDMVDQTFEEVRVVRIGHREPVGWRRAGPTEWVGDGTGWSATAQAVDGDEDVWRWDVRVHFEGSARREDGRYEAVVSDIHITGKCVSVTSAKRQAENVLNYVEHSLGEMFWSRA